jgi:hypothetical protein
MLQAAPPTGARDESEDEVFNMRDTAYPFRLPVYPITRRLQNDFPFWIFAGGVYSPLCQACQPPGSLP